MEQLPEHIPNDLLTIRHWRPSDAPALHDAVIASLEHLRPWMRWIAEEPLTVAQRRELMIGWEADWQSGGDAIYGMFAKSSSREENATTVVGGCGLHRRAGPDTLEIGYWLHVDHGGRGYATETARALTDAALDVTGIRRVEIHHDRANERSGKVPVRLGYGFVEETPREILASSEVGINWHWAVTAADWPAQPST